MGGWPDKINKTVKAVIDTGATLSGVSSDLVKDLNLTQFERAATLWSGAPRIAARYFFNFSVSELLYQIKPVDFPSPAAGPKTEFLLGMDALQFFDLHISRKKNIVQLRHW